MLQPLSPEEFTDSAPKQMLERRPVVPKGGTELLGAAWWQRIQGKKIRNPGVRLSMFLFHWNKRTSARVGMFVSPLFPRNEYFLSSPTDFDSQTFTCSWNKTH